MSTRSDTSYDDARFDATFDDSVAAPVGAAEAPETTAAPSTAPAPRTLRRPIARPSSAALVLATILSCQLMVVLDATIVNVALPDMKHALGFSNTQLSWVLNAYTLTFGGLLLLGARAGDLLGRRRTFLTGIAIFTLASLVGGFAQAGWFLLAARALQGVGGALAAPSSLALLMTMFSEGRERMRAIGLFTTVSLGGGAIGLISGGMLTEWASWRWVMFVNVPIGVLVFLSGRVSLPETARATGRFDLPGAFTSTFGVGSLVFAFVRAASDGWVDALTISSFVAAAVLLTAFVVVELRAEQPITPLRLLTSPSRTSATVARGLLFAGMFGMFFFLTQILQEELGYSSLQAGFAFLPLPLTVLAVSQLTSRVLVARYNGKALMLIGIALAGLGFFNATQLDTTSSYWKVLATLLPVALGNGLSFVPLTSAALAGVPPKDAGAASGLVNVFQQLGGTLGVAILVTVFGSATKHAPQTPGLSPAKQALENFSYGADHAFVASVIFVAVAFAMIAAFVSSPKTARS